MRKALFALCWIGGCVIASAQSSQEISRAALRDKIAGGWAGQMIGVSFGAPTEFRYLQKTIDGDLPKWTPDRVSNALDQDDLYVDMTFAKVLDDKGLDATTEDFGAMFRDAKYRLWHANLAARRALKRGVSASLTGTPKYNAHANDIDFQIESDFIGLMTPGLYDAATGIAWRAGRVMNYGDGIYGGIFVSCMYASAFFEKDPRRVVETGLACLPARSPYARLIADVLAWHKQHPSDWRKNWQLIQEKWDHDEPCPEGALKPFNIDAKLNGAYIALGLLYGEGNMGKTIEVSTRAGQDSDCNPSSAAGILGTMIGYDAIPEEWKSGVPKIADQKFKYTDFTFHTIVDSNEKRALAMVARYGGRVEDKRVVVKTQRARAAKYESWDDYGKPVKRVPASEAGWRFSEGWRAGGGGEDWRTATRKGADVEVEFQGTGAILIGRYLPNGGRYEVFVDGDLDQTLDCKSDEEDAKGGESVWHNFALKPGTHKIRLVTLSDEPVHLQALVVFDKAGRKGKE